MESHARYALIGAFSLACLLAGFFFVYWLKNLGGLGERALYDIRFEQPVSGLILGADVLFNGVHAGTVTRIDLDANNPARVTVEISVNPGTPIRSDTQVDIAFQGLAGASAISLKGGSAQAPRLTSENGHPPVIIAGSGVGRSLTESTQSTLRNIDEILDQNAKPLNEAITGIATFSEMLGRNSKRVEGLIGALENLTGTGTTKSGPALYDLSPATDFPAADVIKARLVIPDPNAVIAFDSQKILIRTGPETLSAIDNAQWVDNLPKLVQARMVQSFENAHQLTAVSRPIEQLASAYRLELTVRNFEVILKPIPTALVDLSVRLIDEKGTVTRANIFTKTLPAQSAEAPDVVAAINKVFSQLAKEIVIWTIEAL